MCTYACNFRECIESGFLCADIAKPGCHSQNKQSGFVLWGASALTHLNYTVHNALTICADTTDHALCVALGQFLLFGIMRAAFAAQYQEAVKACPVVNGNT